MRIVEVKPKSDYTLKIISDDGRTGVFDVSPYLKFEAFADLINQQFQCSLKSKICSTLNSPTRIVAIILNF